VQVDTTPFHLSINLHSTTVSVHFILIVVFPESNTYCNSARPLTVCHWIKKNLY